MLRFDRKLRPRERGRGIGAEALAILIVVAAVTLAGCGGGGDDKTQATAAQKLPDSSGGQEAWPAADDTVTMVTEPADSGARSSPAAKSAGVSSPSSGGSAADAARGLISTPARSEPKATTSGIPTGSTAGAARNYGPYVLQLGSFRSQEHARQRSAELAAAGWQADVVDGVVEKQVYYRVWIGRLPSKEEAIRLGERVKAEMGIPYLVRKIDEPLR
jgi:cell division septation protein DedD